MPAACSLTGLSRTGRSPEDRIKLAALTVARAAGEEDQAAAAAVQQEADARAGVASVADEGASEAVVAEAAAVEVVAEVVEDAATTRTRDPATRFNSHHRLRMYSIT